MSEIIPAHTSAEERPPFAAYLALGFGLLILGVSAILIRAADAPGPVSGFYRMFIGWLVLTPILWLRRKRLRFNRDGLRLTVLAGVFIGFDMVFWTTGIMISGATLPTLMGNTTPLWVGLAVMVLYKEKHPPLFWLGLAIALGGAVVIVGSDAFQDSGLNIGALFGIVSAMFYSSFFLAIQRARKLVDALTTLWVSSFVSALIQLSAALLLGQPLTGYPPRTILIFITMGVLIQVGGWLLITYAQGHIPASVVSPTLLGQPVLTAIFAAPLIGEVLDGIDLLGGAAVLAGVLVVHLSKQRRITPPGVPRAA